VRCLFYGKLGEYRCHNVVVHCNLPLGANVFILMANKSEVFGLFERINIGSYQLWIFVFALKAFTGKKNAYNDV